MQALKTLVVAAIVATALALTATTPAANAPFPMNPYPGASTDYAFYLQTLFGHGSKVKPAKYCAQSSVFQRGNQVVFRLYIVDAHTGHVMNGKDLSRVTVEIPGVPDQLMGFKPQGGNPDATAPWLWSVAWVIPADYPVGTFAFKINATIKKTGKTVTYDPVVPGTDWEITP
jgi:hypothetical protein